MAEGADLAAVGALAVTAAIGLFRELLPPLPEVRRGGYDTKADVRFGEIAGAALTIGIGAVMAVLLRTHEPLTLAVIVAAGIVVVWEQALRTRGN